MSQEGEGASTSNPMDELDSLASNLESAFGVSKKKNDPNKPHPRFSQYKCNVKGDDEFRQESRRLKILDGQKKRRDDFLSIARNIVLGDLEADDDEEDDEAEDVNDNEMDTSGYVPRRMVRQYKNQLMQSEWLVDVPKDLAENWLLVPVPQGRRSLVIAGDGQTRHFNKAGRRFNRFPSNLPGGSRWNRLRHPEAMTFLDCIYVELENTYYVLDLMIWDDFSCYGCDTEFRQFWLASKLSECQDITIKSKVNPFIFKQLPSYPCDRESLSKVLTEPMSFDPLPLDGLLFYHKKVHYLPGSTPLVGWLKGYMVPEMLGIEVSQEIMRQRPNSYSTMTSYIVDYEAETKNIAEQRIKERERRREERAMQKYNLTRASPSGTEAQTMDE